MLLLWPREDSYAWQMYPLLSCLLLRFSLVPADGEGLFAQYGTALQPAQKERRFKSWHWCSTSPGFTILSTSCPPLTASPRLHFPFRSHCPPTLPITPPLTYPTPISPQPTPSSSQRPSPMPVANSPSPSLADTSCPPTLSSACRCSDLTLGWSP